MALDFITAIANATSAVATDIKPFIDQHFAQENENERTKRINEWNDIMSQEDGTYRAGLIQCFIIKLCADAGISVGGVGENISTPLDCLNGFVSLVIAKIKDDKDLANLQFKKA